MAALQPFRQTGSRCCIFLLALGAIWAGRVALGVPVYDLGNADTFAVDLPKASVTVYDSSGPSPVALGPTTHHGSMLIDTGFEYLLMGSAATSELASGGYQTAGTFPLPNLQPNSTINVSQPYSVQVTGSNSSTVGQSNLRLLSGSSLSLYGTGGYNGVLGTPALAGWNMSLGMSDWALPGQNNMSLTTTLSTAPTTAANQVGVALNMVSLPLSGAAATANPLPAQGAVPFADVQVGRAGRTVDGEFLVSTGTVQTMLSPSLAFALGLDKNNNGSLADEAIGTVPITGTGGQNTSASLLKVDTLSVVASDGSKLMLKNLILPVADLGVSAAGILGMDFFTAGWGERALGGNSLGAFSQVDFDFRNASSGTANLLLTLRAAQAPANHDWQNPLNPYDVNQDGVVTPLDALLIINEINLHGNHATAGFGAGDHFFWDVDGDNFIKPLDVLTIVNYLNLHPTGSGVASGPRVPLALVVPEPTGLALGCMSLVALLAVAARRIDPIRQKVL